MTKILFPGWIAIRLILWPPQSGLGPDLQKVGVKNEKNAPTFGVGMAQRHVGARWSSKVGDKITKNTPTFAAR